MLPPAQALNPWLFLLSPITKKWEIALLLAFPLIVLIAVPAALFYLIQTSRTDRNFEEEIQKLKSAGNYIWCWLLLRVWLIRFKAKRMVPYFVLLLTSVAGFVTVVELLLRLQHSVTQLSIAWFVFVAVAIVFVCYLFIRSRTNTLFSSLVIGQAIVVLTLAIVGTIFALVHRGTKFLYALAEFSNLALDSVTSQVPVLVALLAVEVFVLLHHWEEHGKRGRESSVFYALGLLLADLTAQNAIFSALSEDERSEARKDFHSKFYTTVAALLREREIEGLDISIMIFDVSNHCLKIVSVVPEPPRIVEDFQPKPGVGGAGRAFESGNLIYLPSISYGHGIEYEVSQTGGLKKSGENFEMRLIPQVYVPVDREPFKSIVSVPIRDLVSEKIGVVNFSSPHSNAFSTSEFNLLLLAGRILGFLHL